jgi:hypothetical protein
MLIVIGGFSNQLSAIKAQAKAAGRGCRAG